MRHEGSAETSFPILEKAGLVRCHPVPGAETLDHEDLAIYLFDLMIGARKLASARGYNFLAFLLGMAAEEAASLQPGRSGTRTVAPDRRIV